MFRRSRDGRARQRRSLLDLLLSFLLRQTPLGFFIQVIGQLLLVGSSFLLRCHLVLQLTTDKTE